MTPCFFCGGAWHPARTLPSALPKIPNMKAIDRLCQDPVEKSFFESSG